MTAASVGLTGTRKGMTETQKQCVRQSLIEVPISEAHHGDCEGADAEFHDIVREVLPVCRIIIHPPTESKHRAFCRGDVILEQQHYLARNHDIVDVADIIIAAPGEMKEVLRSGTWSTIRYCKQRIAAGYRKTLNQVWPL